MLTLFIANDKIFYNNKSKANVNIFLVLAYMIYSIFKYKRKNII